MHMLMIELGAIFARLLCSFVPPSSALVSFHLERGGMQLHNAVGAHRKKGATTENQGAGA